MTDELDEIIDNLKITLKFAYGVSISEHELQHHKQAIQALIADQMAEYQAQLLKDYKEDIATAVREAEGCVDCKKRRCENCERLWAT